MFGERSVLHIVQVTSQFMFQLLLVLLSSHTSCHLHDADPLQWVAAALTGSSHLLPHWSAQNAPFSQLHSRVKFSPLVISLRPAFQLLCPLNTLLSPKEKTDLATLCCGGVENEEAPGEQQGSAGPVGGSFQRAEGMRPEEDTALTTLLTA